MKFLLDLLPLILFFVTFKVADGNTEAASRLATEHFGFLVAGGVIGPTEAPVLLATLVVIVATVLQIATLLALRRKVDTMLWITFAMVTVLGGATVWFHDPLFIKWKPSAVYWAMALAMAVAQYGLGKNLLQSMLSAQMELPAAAWRSLGTGWIAFLVAMGGLNLLVAYNTSTSNWATFKVFGLPVLTVLFLFVQFWWLQRRYAPPDGQVAVAGTPADGTGKPRA